METIEQIREAARQLVRELHLLDGRHCIEGFSFSECHFITELEKLGEATASELGERLVLEKSTISRLVRGLLKRGLIESVTDGEDRRRKLLKLTTAGREGAGRIHRYAISQVSEALAFIPDQEQEQLVAGLGRYAGALRYARLSENLHTRTIRRKDNPAVSAIIRDVMTEFGAVGEGYSIEDPEVDDMHGSYAGNGSRFWVIERGPDILGCGGYGPLSGGDAGVCELRKMYFRPELRGYGQGSLLLNRCLVSAAEAGYSTMYLETLSHMEGARRLYLRHGFEPLCEPMGATGHSACNSWMARKLGKFDG